MKMSVGCLMQQLGRINQDATVIITIEDINANIITVDDLSIVEHNNTIQIIGVEEQPDDEDK